MINILLIIFIPLFVIIGIYYLLSLAGIVRFWWSVVFQVTVYWCIVVVIGWMISLAIKILSQ